MRKRRLTSDEKRITALQQSLPKMKEATNFLKSMKAFKSLRYIEDNVYRLYFDYSVETENQSSGMTYETLGNYSIVSRKQRDLKVFANLFNKMTEDEQLAVLAQLFPKDFEVGGEDAIIGFDRNDEDEQRDKRFKASVRKCENKHYV